MVDINKRLNEIAQNVDTQSIINEMLDLVLDLYKAPAGSIVVFDSSEQFIKYSIRNPKEKPGIISMETELEFGALSIKKKQTQHINLCLPFQDNTHIPLSHTNPYFRNILAFPLFAREKALGIVHIYNPEIFDFSLLDTVIGRLSTEIEKSILLMGIQDLSKRQRALTRIIEQVVTTLDREQLLRIIIDNARQLLDAEAASLFLIDNEAGDIELKLASNIDSDVLEVVKKVRVPYGKGIIGFVIQSGETVIVQDTSLDSRHYGNVDDQSGFITHSLLAVPLTSREVFLGIERGKTNERIIGGIEAVNKMSGRFTEEDAEILRTLANQTATVLEIARLYNETNELSLDVIEVLTAAIDAKDPYTEGHSQRVSHFSVEIALEMRLPAETIQQIKIGGLLHDVGKIGIPDAILSKPGKLSNEEYEKMKEHPSIGAKIMRDVHMLIPILPALSAHHEKLDGMGYPNRLSASEIPLISRIITVADVFDAMTSNRPYRKALSAETAFQYLRDRTGEHFDLRCIDALMSAYNKNRIYIQHR